MQIDPIDITEFMTRMNALSKQEQRMALKTIPDRMLWDELFARFICMRRKIKNAEKAMGMR